MDSEELEPEEDSMAPGERHEAQVNGCQISYWDYPLAEADSPARPALPPLLLVHGFPLDGTMWRGQVPALRAVQSGHDAHAPLAGQMRVLIPDLRGHGNSAAPRGAHSLDVFADDLKELLDSLSIPQVIFAGLSMGGYIAFAFYRRYPERIRALLLADTRAQADTTETRATRERLALVVEKKGAAAFAAEVLPRYTSGFTTREHLEVVEQVREMMLNTAPHSIAATEYALAARPDSTPTLAMITCPTLITVGEHDAITPPFEAQYMAERIAHARLEVIPRVGHMAPLEDPAAFNRVLLSFLEELVV